MRLSKMLNLHIYIYIYCLEVLRDVRDFLHVFLSGPAVCPMATSIINSNLATARPRRRPQQLGQSRIQRSEDSSQAYSKVKSCFVTADSHLVSKSKKI